MAHTALTPVFTGLRTALHVLVGALTALVVARGVITATPWSGTVVALSVVFLVTYGVGGYAGRHRDSPTVAYLWLLALSLEWVLILWLIPEGAYLVFPLFFLYIHLLPRWWGTVAVLLTTAMSVLALGLHAGWTIGGVVGPMVGAGVAIVIGLGYRSLAREAAERERLLQELIATQGRLAATEHESGVLAERARLAREIHDTVAQGLSSIQMLLHAAERADPARPGIEHVRLARETAAANLADTRRFIRELAPAALVDQGIGAALERLSEVQWRRSVAVDVRVPDTVDLPMYLQTALLRICQGAMGNVVQHAQAQQAVISIERDEESVRLIITDDGIGFDPVAASAERSSGGSDSFGLIATRERVDQLGGTLEIDTGPGRGTRLIVVLGVGAP
ncbi:sensor histidine kinase [Glaciibacter sp. 2TAF33]|uniref:sensor histidine kinase n=1 Tax=Glaciibacter sp. 2TAF33 TaxID=3233015 RepID=UPI003F8F3D07